MTKQTTETNDPTWPPGVIPTIIAACLVSALVFFVYWLQFHTFTISRDPKEWGPFGDYVGGLLNPFVAFCALILLAHSLRMQAIELGRALEEFKKATKMMSTQNFEGNLWQLLRLHHEFANSIVLSTSTNAQVSGRACFRVFHRRLADLYEISLADGTDAEAATPSKDLANNIYRSFLLDYEWHISHYFRLLERVLILICDKDKKDRNKDKKDRKLHDQQIDEKSGSSVHVETVRASLSHDELVVLFFHGIEGRPALKKLIEDYHLLSSLPKGSFPHAPFNSLYDASAFQKDDAATKAT